MIAETLKLIDDIEDRHVPADKLSGHNPIHFIRADIDTVYRIAASLIPTRDIVPLGSVLPGIEIS